MARGGDDRDAIHARLVGEGAQQLADHRARWHDLAEDRRRQPEPAEQIHGPGPRRRVEALRRAGDRQLVRQAAAQPVAEEVGHHQQPVGRLEGGGPAQLQREELIEGVDRHEARAGAPEDLLAADVVEGRLGRALGEAVPVVVRVAQQRPLVVQQREVDAPGVDGHAGDLAVRLARGGRQPELDLAEDPQHVRVQAVRHAHGTAVEAVRLAQRQASAVEAAEHDAAALGAEVDRQEVDALAHGPSASATRGTSMARAAARFPRAVSPARRRTAGRSSRRHGSRLPARRARRTSSTRSGGTRPPPPRCACTPGCAASRPV